VDRETREISSDEMRELLETKLRSLGITEDFRIGVVDRMIENWIVADWKNFTNYCKKSVSAPDETDGIGGKSLVKKYIPNYKETIDGVSLLAKIDPVVVVQKSPSFRKFISDVIDLECWWLDSVKSSFG
jgi:hypothetical protein